MCTLPWPIGHHPFYPSPACGDRIGRADNVDIEHGADPELAADKVAERDADEEADCLEAGGVRDQGDEEDGGREHEHDDRRADAGAEDVQDRPHEDAAGDGAGDSGDTCM